MLNADVAAVIQTTIVFAAPIGAIVMHRHYRNATGWLRWFIVTLRVLGVIAAPFAVWMLIGALTHLM